MARYNRYTVAEAGNIGLGQNGSFFLDSNTDTTVTGGVIIAITIIGAGTFFEKLIAEDTSNCYGTATASGIGGTAIVGDVGSGNDNSFPAGLTIYGRCTQVQIPASAAGGIICYMGA